jgi:DNA topoisomerase VI subunit B
LVLVAALATGRVVKVVTDMTSEAKTAMTRLFVDKDTFPPNPLNTWCVWGDQEWHGTY